ncbi:MAG TPA: hypothetical protein VGU20_31200 [Stellaceae bacterium]|nr:hypothetical protein [Terriglobia bacterium]HEV2551819.1 hypothetical protein [Stellaceae bacterium]
MSARYKAALTLRNNAPAVYGVYDTADKSQGFNGKLLREYTRQDDAECVAECLEDVSRPGKFQGCAPYVPMYWAAWLNGFADRDDGRVIGFDVTPEDKVRFPELKKRRTVKLIETGDGFVCEV